MMVQINLQHSKAQPYGICNRVIYLTQTHLYVEHHTEKQLDIITLIMSQIFHSSSYITLLTMNFHSLHLTFISLLLICLLFYFIAPHMFTLLTMNFHSLHLTYFYFIAPHMFTLLFHSSSYVYSINYELA